MGWDFWSQNFPIFPGKPLYDGVAKHLNLRIRKLIPTYLRQFYVQFQAQCLDFQEEKYATSLLLAKSHYKCGLQYQLEMHNELNKQRRYKFLADYNKFVAGREKSNSSRALEQKPDIQGLRGKGKKDIKSKQCQGMIIEFQYGKSVINAMLTCPHDLLSYDTLNIDKAWALDFEDKIR